MIVKKVKYTDTDKPKVWQIGDLVDYIRSPHNTNAQEKIAHAGSTHWTKNRNDFSGSGERSQQDAGEPLGLFVEGK